MTSPSRKDIQEGVKRTLSRFHVMATGCGCALVQLQPLTGGSEQCSAGDMSPLGKTVLDDSREHLVDPKGIRVGSAGGSSFRCTPTVCHLAYILIPRGSVGLDPPRLGGLPAAIVIFS